MGKRGPQKGSGGRPRKPLNEKIIEGKTAKVMRPKVVNPIINPTVAAEKNAPYPQTTVEYSQSNVAVTKMVEEVKTPTTAYTPPAYSIDDFPEPAEYLNSRQKQGELKADIVFRKVWAWLKTFGCERLVTEYWIESYAMNTARWRQCEEITSALGFIAQHPTTKEPMSSPYVSIAREYCKAANSIWDKIYNVVRENATGDYQSNKPDTDAMEIFLRTKRD